MGHKMNCHSAVSRLDHKEDARSLPCDLNDLKVGATSRLQANLEFRRERSIWRDGRIIPLTLRVLGLKRTFFIAIEWSCLRNGVGGLARRTMPSRICYFGDQ